MQPMSLAPHQVSNVPAIPMTAPHPHPQPVSSRFDNSLGLLTRKFVDLLRTAHDGLLDLNLAANTLQVQ